MGSTTLSGMETLGSTVSDINTVSNINIFGFKNALVRIAIIAH